MYPNAEVFCEVSMTASRGSRKSDAKDREKKDSEKKDGENKDQEKIRLSWNTDNLDRGKIQFAISLVLSLIFLIVAMSISNWRCGTVLNSCLNTSERKSYQIVGGLLVCAILLNFGALGAVITDCITVTPWAWALGPTALGLTWLGGIFALAAIAYYFKNVDATYCPLLSIIGMSFALAMAITTSITMLNERRAAMIHDQPA
ncbi:unnamed protein product [Dibothriocephalus latus]|uniref:Uncharacterized protein n=1 Tax=Dibothriocephalus latus TaxID=60516 RepID=A0A3P7P914_DIBLA|nr:unnamed protein product [Dibothriocephalus latus]